MITRTVFLFIVSFMSLSLFANMKQHVATCGANGSCTLKASGTVNLSQTRNPMRAKTIAFRVNDKVAGTLKLYQSRVNNKDLVKGQFLLDNTSNKKSYFRYKVVLKDKVGVVAQSKGEIHLNQGKNQKMRFGSIVMPAEHMENITTYEIQVVETNGKLR